METVIKFLTFIGIFIVIGVVISLPVMWLWNWLMPEIFGLITITFWQALGLSLLSSFLFKSTNSSN